MIDIPHIPPIRRSVFRSRTLSQLIVTSWGRSLVALFVMLLAAMGVYWNYPLYNRPNQKLTPLQEFLPLILAGIVWLLLVVVIVAIASRYGRKNKLPPGNLRHLRIADVFLMVLALVVSACVPGRAGDGIATFVNATLLVLCLLHLSIIWLVARRINLEAAVCAFGVAFSIVLRWI